MPKVTRPRKQLVTLSGKALISTIATMETLGVIGQEVLAANGIVELEAEKQYPYEIRNAIHRAVFDKYGEIALVMIGHLNAESLVDSPLIEPVLKKAAELKISLASDKTAQHEGALAEVFNVYLKGSDEVIKMLTSGGSAEYGTRGTELSPTSWKLTTTMAMDLFQEPFIRGVLDYIFTRAVGRYFEWSIDYKKEESHAEYGYVTWVWHLNFNRRVSQQSSYEIFVAKSNALREKLMKAVLDDATDKSKKMERVSNEISKYIPPQIHSAIFSGEYDTRIATRRKKLTIFFSDIVNFTSTSESLQPEDLTKYLNEYFSEMTTIALDCGATIDKYIGDAMMVFFGDPQSAGEKEDARRCVGMALRMQEKMKNLQEKWRNEGFADPFQVRMGVNTGYCNVGNFGSEQRLTYTIIGGEVNVTQRLEAGADANGILMSYETYAHAQDIIEVEERETIKMKGISREIKVFSVVGKKTAVKQIKVSKKPIKRELSEYELMKKDIAFLKTKMKKVNESIEILLKKI